MSKAINWSIRNKRPEDSFPSEEFYDSTEASRYESNSAMKRVQTKITGYLLDLLDVDSTQPISILDAGCGTGFSLSFLKELNPDFILKGFDSSKEMLELAKKKGFQVKLGKLQKIPFNDKFDLILSISVLQWISKDELEKVASEFYRVLKKGGKVGIQYYPESEKRLFEDAMVFKKKGFKVVVTENSYYNPVKRKLYITLYKEV